MAITLRGCRSSTFDERCIRVGHVHFRTTWICLGGPNGLQHRRAKRHPRRRSLPRHDSRVLIAGHYPNNRTNVQGPHRDRFCFQETVAGIHTQISNGE